MFIKKDTYGVGTGRLRKLRVLSAIIVGCCVLFINTAGVAANGSVHTESEKKPEPIAEGEVSAALLAEVGTGRVVYEYNSEEKLPAAGSAEQQPFLRQVSRWMRKRCSWRRL